MNDIKQIRKVARAIKTLLETEGVKAKTPVIMDKIKDSDLTDITALKDSVANDMRSATPVDEPKVAEKSVARKQRIETFMVSNWASIKDNEDVREALLNAFCQGRISKDKRSTMKKELLAKCDPNYVAPAAVDVAELADETTEALAGALLSDESSETKYDF